MGWLVAAIAIVLGISVFFDVIFWLKSKYHQREQERLEEEMIQRLEAVSETFSEFRADVDTALTHVENRTAKLTDPTQREKQIVTEVKERWQVAMLEQAEQFDKELKAAYEKACEAINFQVIEYKKTIEKGRKKAYRAKNPNRAPQFRSIDDQ
jgi:uncharacterized membrane-anchored protein YhcB (DUF1043 family)